MQLKKCLHHKQASHWESLLVLVAKTVNCFLNGLCSAVGYTLLTPLPRNAPSQTSKHSHHPPPVQLTYRTLSKAGQKRSPLFSMSSPFWSPGKMAHGGGVSQIRDLVRPYMGLGMAHRWGCCNSCIPTASPTHLLPYYAFYLYHIYLPPSTMYKQASKARRCDSYLQI